MAIHKRKKKRKKFGISIKVRLVFPSESYGATTTSTTTAKVIEKSLKHKFKNDLKVLNIPFERTFTLK